MRFQLDYDLTTIYHIHSQLSLCSKDPEQNLENILRIAKDLGLRPICLADHRGRQCQTLLQRARLLRQAFVRTEVPYPANIDLACPCIIEMQGFIDLEFKRPGAAFRHRHLQHGTLFGADDPGFIAGITCFIPK